MSPCWLPEAGRQAPSATTDQHGAAGPTHHGNAHAGAHVMPAADTMLKLSHSQRTSSSAYAVHTQCSGVIAVAHGQVSSPAAHVAQEEQQLLPGM
jgi:hypothetical protein